MWITISCDRIFCDRGSDYSTTRVHFASVQGLMPVTAHMFSLPSGNFERQVTRYNNFLTQRFLTFRCVPCAKMKDTNDVLPVKEGRPDSTYSFDAEIAPMHCCHGEPDCLAGIMLLFQTNWHITCRHDHGLLFQFLLFFVPVSARITSWLCLFL